jgi:DNA-binding response OmpR family regulator
VPSAVLLHDPETESREFLERHLREDGFDVVGATRNREALDLIERTCPDLVLLAESDLCRRLREGEPGRRWNKDVPVIVLAPPDADPLDRVRALERGADDVLARPIAYDELLARIRALLRRTAPNPHDRIDAGEIVVDRRTRHVLVRSTPVKLSGREFDLVVKLASEPFRVWTKDELLRDVWGFRSASTTRTVDSHASRLRRKLCLAATDRFVVNAWGIGYRLLE